MEFYPGFENNDPYARKRRSNKVTVKITGIPTTDIPTKMLLQKFCLLRNAESVGDTETVNMTQLGKLKYHNIQFEKLNS
jgi:hypothetical protein